MAPDLFRASLPPDQADVFDAIWPAIEAMRQARSAGDEVTAAVARQAYYAACRSVPVDVLNLLFVNMLGEGFVP